MSKLIAKHADVALVSFLFFSLFMQVGFVNAAEQMPVKGTYETTSSVLLSNRTTAEGIIYRTLNVKAQMSGDLEGMLEYLVFQEIDTKTAKATSTGFGTFTGRVKGRGPGQAAFSFVASIEGFNTTQSSLVGQFWHDRGRNGLDGYRLEGSFRGTTASAGTYEGQAVFGEVSADALGPIAYIILAIGIAVAVIAIIFTRRK